ncbi:hypothetical protein MHYP_G00320890 [Metynnis hypsauchen]
MHTVVRWSWYFCALLHLLFSWVEGPRRTDMRVGSVVLSSTPFLRNSIDRSRGRDQAGPPPPAALDPPVQTCSMAGGTGKTRKPSRRQCLRPRPRQRTVRPKTKNRAPTVKLSRTVRPRHRGKEFFSEFVRRRIRLGRKRILSIYQSVKMLVPVEYKEVRKWVRVSKKEDVDDYSEFITEILTKFGLPKETHVDLKDSSGIDVDSDIFNELVKSSQVSFVVSTEESSVLCMSSDERQSSSESSFCSEDSASSGSTLILESTKARRRQLIPLQREI